MFENLRKDIARYQMYRSPGLCGWLHWLNKWLAAYGLHAVLVYRYGQWVDRRFQRFYLAPLRLCFRSFYFLFHKIVYFLYDIYISPDARIGPGLYIGHFGGIEIRKCRIGCSCSVQQQVKIGSRNGNGPDIGSHVWIGAYSRITGAVTVADRATVAAGAVVEKDIAADYLVMGNPARVINRKYDNSDILGTVL